MEPTMHLSEYLQKNKLTPGDFAKLIGVKSRMTVHRYLNGARIPTRRVMRRIEEITGGKVTLSDFIEPLPEPGDDIQNGVEAYGHQKYNWSRLSERDQIRIDKAFDLMRQESPEWESLSPALKEAVHELDEDITVKPSGDHTFSYKGRRIDARQLVRLANLKRQKEGRSPIPYPGVYQIHRRDRRFQPHPFLRALSRMKPRNRHQSSKPKA